MWKQEPVRLFAAVQATLAAVVATVHWLTEFEIPTNVTAVWLLMIAGWLEFGTRRSVTPIGD